jgi:small subunit ribosomal protein S5
MEKKMIAHVCSLRRVSRVMKGGKVMRFSALVVAGDGKGRIGYGLGRSVEVAEAIKKAAKAAEKKMLFVPFKQGRTIHHDVCEKFGGSTVYIKSAKPGRGIIAGGSTRSVFEALGIKDVVCKALGSPNPHNVVKAVFKALESLQTPKKIARLRGMSVAGLFKVEEGTV